MLPQPAAASSRYHDLHSPLSMAAPSCHACGGSGRLPGRVFDFCRRCGAQAQSLDRTHCSACRRVLERSSGAAVCECVHRQVFSTVLARYRQYGHDQVRHARRYHQLEFRADVELIARRWLDDAHLAVFRACYIDNLEGPPAYARAHQSRGAFYNHLYRLQAHLGRIFAELQPYGLFPPHAYGS